MNKVSRILILSACLALLGMLLVPVAAQELGPGEGAPVIL